MNIIMIMTFFIMLVGFLILDVKNPAILALLISLLDALPLLGVGTVLIPLSVYQLLLGNLYLGIGLAVLFVINELVRQFAEPKVLGKNLGIHPIISLVLLYAGYYFFGFMGLLIIPIATVIINALVNKDNSAKVT